MKKIIIILSVMLTAISTMAFNQRAFYVVKGDDIAIYKFGVASDLKFSNNGRTLTVTGYSESINLDEIDYITFNPPTENIGMTPSAQKEKMIKIGEEINKRTDLNKVPELMRMLHVYTATHTNEDNEFHYPSVEFSFPREFWDTHEMIEITKNLLELSTGNFAASRALAANTVKLYKASDFYGIYRANEEHEIWEKIDAADFLEIQFMSQDNTNYYIARLECSDDVTTWTTSQFVTRAPKTMTLSLFFKEELLAKSIITTEMVQGQSISLKFASDADVYDVKTDIGIYNDSIIEHTYVTVDGEYFLESNSKIDGKDLLKYEVMKPAIKDCFEEDLGNGEYKDPDMTALFAQLYRAHSHVDVMNMLQTDGRIYEFGKLYNVLKDDSEDNYSDYIVDLGDGYSAWAVYDKKAVWDKEKNIIIWDDGREMNVSNGVKHLGDYTDIKFFYDGKKTMQGLLSWEPKEEIDEQENWFEEWESNKMSGYTIYKEKIISVRREPEYYYNETTEQTEFRLTGWFIEGYHTETGESKKITVSEKDVFFPAMTRRIYHESEPVLIFPDMTIFAFGDYFTNDSFSKLVDDYKDLINLFKEICNITDEDW